MRTQLDIGQVVSFTNLDLRGITRMYLTGRPNRLLLVIFMGIFKHLTVLKQS